MEILEALRKRRSIRLFEEGKEISDEILEELVDIARLAPSAGNCQPIEFLIVKNKEKREKLFEHLKFARYVAPKRTPKVNQRPSAYIIILINNQRKFEGISGHSDAALCSLYIMISCMNWGLGSCLLCSIDRDKIRELFSIPQYCEIYGVVALGYPKEQPMITQAKGDIKYFLDEQERLIVPKRALYEVLHKESY